MVDCKWNGGSRVSLGQKCELASGLMEITYDTGAKVILQGPVTYSVETNGGYLAVGKLTGKLEKKVVSGQWPVVSKSNINNPQSSISNPHYPLSTIPFTIRTPTATVTDLGTEFGVEVNKQGATTSHVFRGSVELQVASADGNAEGDARVLHENQSARVDNAAIRAAAHRVTVFVPSAKPVKFVRKIPKRVIKTLDLVDVVAGGDGFGKARDRGIDPTTGRTTALQAPVDKATVARLASQQPAWLGPN